MTVIGSQTRGSTGPLGDLGALFDGALPADATVTSRWRSRTAQLFRVQGSGSAPWSDVVIKVPDAGQSFDPAGIAEQARWFAKVLHDADSTDCDVPTVLDHDAAVPAICFPYVDGTDLNDLFPVVDAARRDDLLARCGRLLGTLHVAGRKDEVLDVQQRAAAVADAEKVCRRVGCSYARMTRHGRRPLVVWSADDFGPVNVRIDPDDGMHLLDPPSRPIPRIVEADLARFALGCWQQLAVNLERPADEVQRSIDAFVAGYCETGPVAREHLNHQLVDRRIAYQFLQKVVNRLRARQFRDAVRMARAFVRFRVRRSAPPAA